MSHFILVHGFNDASAGRKNIDKAGPLLVERGHTVDTDSTDYGWFGLVWVRMRKRPAVLRIIAAIKNALNDDLHVVVVGYSNGCNYALKALRLIFNGKVTFILVHPALRRRAEFPASVRKAWVCFTRSDFVVRLANLVRFIVPAWGSMGARGYKGTDKRVQNIDYTDVAGGHGGLWKDSAIKFFVDELHRLAGLNDDIQD